MTEARNDAGNVSPIESGYAQHFVFDTSLIQVAHHLRISQIPENDVMCHLGAQRCGISYVLPVRFVPDISQQFLAHMCEFGEFMMFITSCGTPNKKLHPIKNHPQYESRNGLVSTFGLVYHILSTKTHRASATPQGI